MLYYVENETQPEYFPNIFESLKWSIKTMIFLGFEPSNPLTPVGNILGMLLIVFGLGWLTLPISIISSGFIEEISTKKNCPHCGKEL
jgi:voltage-gated potassium channel